MIHTGSDLLTIPARVEALAAVIQARGERFAFLPVTQARPVVIPVYRMGEGR